MHRVIAASTIAIAITGTSLLSAAPGQSKPKDPKTGTRITITGCLHQGTSSDSYVLLGLTERPADATAADNVQVVPYFIYWLDSNDGLKGLVGEIVDVTGKVAERKNRPGTITVSVDPSETESTDVEVARKGTKDVTSEKFDPGPLAKGTSGASGLPSKLEVSRPVYKLNVETVKAVTTPGGPACR